MTNERLTKQEVRVSVKTKSGEIREYKFPNESSAKSFYEHPRAGWKMLTKPYLVKLENGRYKRQKLHSEEAKKEHKKVVEV